MVLQFDLEIDNDLADVYREVAIEAPRTFQAFMAGTMTQHLQEEVNRKIAITPGAVVYPIAWANPITPPPGKHANMPGGLWSKQKAAYFATNGFGGGIPSTRTGGFTSNWFARFDLSNFSIGVGNSTMTQGSPGWPSQPLFNFLMGEKQQQFHKNTGWFFDDDALVEIVIASMDILADAWFDIWELNPPL